MSTMILSVALSCIILGSFTTSVCEAYQSASDTSKKDVLKIALSNTSETYKVGSDIEVVVSVENTSASPIYLGVFKVPHAEYRNLRFTLTLDGQEVAKTSFHRALRGEYGASDPEVPTDFGMAQEKLEPGQIDHIAIDLKKLFTIKAPGTYFFSVEMTRTELGSNGAVYANPLQIRIVP